MKEAGAGIKAREFQYNLCITCYNLCITCVPTLTLYANIMALRKQALLKALTIIAKVIMPTLHDEDQCADTQSCDVGARNNSPYL